MNRRFVVGILLFLLCFASAVRADLNIGSLGTAGVITFDSTLAGVNLAQYDGGGISPSPSGGSGNGRLDSNSWAITGNGSDGPSSDGTLNFGQSDTSGDFARGGPNQEDVDSSGLWSFDRDNSSGKAGIVNAAFGVKQDDTHFTSGTVTLKVKNSTGFTAPYWSVAYDLYSYNNTNSSSSIKFSYSTDDSTYTSVAALDFTSPTTVDSGVTVGNNTDWSAATNRATTLNVSVPNTGNLYLRWTFDDATLAVDRDQLAMDDITVIAGVPEPGAYLFGALVCGVMGIRYGRRRLLSTLSYQSSPRSSP